MDDDDVDEFDELDEDELDELELFEDEPDDIRDDDWLGDVTDQPSPGYEPDPDEE